jgi:hypothetical protein
MAFATLLDRLLRLFSFILHNLVKMDLIMQEIIVLKSFERLEHFLYIFLEHLNQPFVLDFDVLLHESGILKSDTLSLLFENGLESTNIVVFILDAPCFDVDDLTKLLHAI